MTTAPEISKPPRQRVDRRMTIAGLALAVVLHITWWMALPVNGLMASGTLGSGPVVSYLAPPPAGSDRAAIQSDVRALRSPTIFSLPTPLGFSRTFLEQQLVAPQPIRTTVATPALRVRDFEEHPESGKFPQDILQSTARLAPAVPALAATSGSTYSKRQPVARAVMSLTWLDGLSALKATTIDVEPGSVWDDEKPWEATLAVEIGTGGAVEHVFVEKPTPNRRRNADLAVLVKSLKLPPPDANASGRLSIRFNGRPAAPALIGAAP